LVFLEGEGLAILTMLVFDHFKKQKK